MTDFKPHDVKRAEEQRVSRRESQDETYVVSNGKEWSKRALQARVTEIEHGIIYYQEIEASTACTHEVMAKRMRALGERHGQHWVAIIDLSDVKTRPAGAYKAALIDSMRKHTAHVAMVQPGSVLLRTALRFLAARRRDNISVHATYEQAFKAARDRITTA